MVFERCGVVPELAGYIADLVCTRVKRQTKSIEQPETFLKALRAFAPKDGDDWVKAILVSVQPGDSIPEHEHPEHTILFYPDPVGPVVVQGRSIQPEVGEVIYLPPNTKHAVPKNEGLRARISVAMLVNT